MNFNVGFDNMISTAYLAAQYLKSKNFTGKVFIVGSTGISRELDSVGIRHLGVGPDVLTGSIATLVKEEFKPDPEVGAVVVGFDEHISFPKILKAATYLDKKDTIFVATNTDERFPMPSFVVPGTGSIVRSIETCSERKVKFKKNSNFEKYLKKFKFWKKNKFRKNLNFEKPLNSKFLLTTF